MPDSQPSRYPDRTHNATVADWLDTLIELIFQRLSLAEDVAAEKFSSGRPVDDPAREQQILDRVARTLEGAGPYQQAVLQFFRNQIAANKIIQRGLHQHWRAHPEEIPAVHPGLADQIRPELDRITARMVWQLAYMNELPELGRAHIQDLLDKKLATRPFVRRFRGLGRDAATVALGSFVAGRRTGPPVRDGRSRGQVGRRHLYCFS